MSRASSVNRGNVRPTSVNRGNVRNLEGVADRNRDFANPTRNQVNDFLRNDSGRIAAAKNRSPDRNINRQELGNNIRNDINRDRPNYQQWFGNDFWDKHNTRPAYLNNRANWWAIGTAAGIGNWLGWEAATPYYYDSFDDTSSIAEPTYVEPVYSQPTYATPAPTPAPAQESQTVAAAETSGDNWMPLGVFAVSREGSDDVTPTLFLQLALNKNGSIAGTYYNTATDSTYTAEGSVDKNSQLVAWKVSDNQNSPIFQTGIYNLSQPEVPIKVNYTDGRKGTLELIRLEGKK